MTTYPNPKALLNHTHWTTHSRNQTLAHSKNLYLVLNTTNKFLNRMLTLKIKSLAASDGASDDCKTKKAIFVCQIMQILYHLCIWVLNHHFISYTCTDRDSIVLKLSLSKPNFNHTSVFLFAKQNLTPQTILLFNLRTPTPSWLYYSILPFKRTTKSNTQIQLN